MAQTGHSGLPLLFHYERAVLGNRDPFGIPNMPKRALGGLEVFQNCTHFTLTLSCNLMWDLHRESGMLIGCWARELQVAVSDMAGQIWTRSGPDRSGTNQKYLLVELYELSVSSIAGHVSTPAGCWWYVDLPLGRGNSLWCGWRCSHGAWKTETHTFIYTCLDGCVQDVSFSVSRQLSVWDNRFVSF